MYISTNIRMFTKYVDLYPHMYIYLYSTHTEICRQMSPSHIQSDPKGFKIQERSDIENQK